MQFQMVDWRSEVVGGLAQGLGRASALRDEPCITLALYELAFERT